MKRTTFFLAVELAFMALLCGRARAEEPLEPEAHGPYRKDVSRFLPNTAGASATTSTDVTNAWGGYDGGARTPVFGVTTELRLVRRVSLIGGVAYTSASAADPGMRPQLGARVQVLEQAASGVDASAALLFRKDRFSSEEGLFQGSIALGRSFGETSAVVNVVYGQDGEGDDHQGEVRLAGVRRVAGGLHLGVEGRYMRALASTDPHRATLGTPSMEAMAGPLVAYTAGSWVLVAEAGVSNRQTSHLETGLVTVAGVGTSF
jgi:hypothetical protein